jgi:2'-5' RNA ligase
MRAKGVSLWLVPRGEAHEDLARLVRDASARSSGPAFEPHVTLVPGVEGDVDRVLHATARLAARTAPFEIRLAALGWRDEYFRCLFVEVQKDPELMALASAAREMLDLPAEPGYFPHLSLLYADLGAGSKPELAREVPPRPAGFLVQAIHVYRTQGPVAGWHRLACFGFRRRPAWRGAATPEP